MKLQQLVYNPATEEREPWEEATYEIENVEADPEYEHLGPVKQITIYPKTKEGDLVHYFVIDRSLAEEIARMLGEGARPERTKKGARKYYTCTSCGCNTYNSVGLCDDCMEQRGTL